MESTTRSGGQIDILVTGVTGLVGRHVLYELVRQNIQRQWNIAVVLRADDEAHARARFRGIVSGNTAPEYLDTQAIRARIDDVKIISADVTDSGLKGALSRQIAPSGKIHVIHSAAITKLFHDTRTEREIIDNNYLGSLNLVSALEGFNFDFAYISTAFSCGAARGVIGDDYIRSDRGAFRNPYENYKAKTEHELYEYCAARGIRFRILRPSVVCGRLMDAPLYYTSKFDVLYGWARFFHGLIAAGRSERIRIQCNPRATLNMVPVDYTAKCIVAAFTADIEQLNIAHSSSIPVPVAIERVLDAVGYGNYELVDKIPADPNRSERLYYRSVAPAIGPYITGEHFEFDTTRLAGLVTPLEEPPVEEHIHALMSYAIGRDFAPMPA